MSHTTIQHRTPTQQADEVFRQKLSFDCLQKTSMHLVHKCSIFKHLLLTHQQSTPVPGKAPGIQTYKLPQKHVPIYPIAHLTHLQDCGHAENIQVARMHPRPVTTVSLPDKRYH